MYDGAGTFERGTGDGLGADERAILARWDAGDPPAAIAAATGASVDRVRYVARLYDDTPEPDPRPRLREADERFLAAVERERVKAPRPPFAIDVDEIVAMLADKIESLVHDLLPNARKEAHEMCVGSLGGEPGHSMRINVGAGSKRGWWKDFAGTDTGNPLGLIAAVLFAGDYKRAVPWAKSWLHLDDADPGRIEQHRIEAKARGEERARGAAKERARGIGSARSRWLQARPIERGDPVDRYLAGRGIDLGALGRAPGALRFHPALAYGYKGPELPAMVAQVTNLAGEHVATHRTWLDVAAGGKAGPELLGFDKAGRPNDPKKAMGAVMGGHIPLWKGMHRCPLRDVPARTDVYVSEGIEDGLTAACADPSIRVVCMLALSFFAEMELPAQMGRLVVLAQNDPPGSSAAKALARAVTHHRAAGRHVLLAYPPKGVKDLNELAMRRVG